ncbi:NADH-quinone oxidoreductase subunit K [Moorella humiferrea]|uniref:NADH-quinone oxidoreductase subunit K n=1 Tax=Neomoorella humiferrea TaxID=676965 RepID=A0A2T0AUM9_9FIRM|nr:NADH-quinone oxidoreductase subunit NuoK [Moorella humiferrea]PRR74200.1 NADH-quinone oxidoreductase subunit K [Moorella humiferrea]
MITLTHYLAVGGLLFCIGLFGALAKKNAIAVLMGIELMLNAVNINLVAFNHFLQPAQVTGQIFAIFVIVVAAAEVAVGLALVINIYRRRLDSSVDDLDWLKW